MEVPTKIDVLTSLKRQSIRIPDCRALSFDRITKLLKILIVVIDHQQQLSGVGLRSPQEVILMSTQSRRQTELSSQNVDRARVAVILQKDPHTLLLFRRQRMKRSTHVLRQ